MGGEFSSPGEWVDSFIIAFLMMGFAVGIAEMELIEIECLGNHTGCLSYATELGRNFRQWDIILILLNRELFDEVEA